MKRHGTVIFEALLSIFILIDILVLGLMTVGFLVGIMPTTVYGMSNYDLAVAVLILLDFIFIIRKENRNGWIRNNWFYIVSIVPLTFICFNIFQLFNYISLIGLIGIFRIYTLHKVLRITSKAVIKYPSKTKLDYATVLLFLVLIIGSFLFFVIEHGVNPNVPNYESAMWYAVVSMTTTGYGDIVPINLSGRIIGVIFILSGMAYLSLTTATLAYSFIDIFRKDTREALKELKDRNLMYEEKLDKLNTKLDKIDKKMDKKEKH
ncbi:potassium channel family protein [Methanobacterium oryzae]|uniref:potassium channel family protein n=1 Tax=Methanobacterium oryzae TaxID=69540 RepID=UPI003D24B46C